MSLTPSKMIPIGTIAPEFVITDGISKVKKNLEDFMDELEDLVDPNVNHNIDPDMEPEEYLKKMGLDPDQLSNIMDQFFGSGEEGINEKELVNLNISLDALTKKTSTRSYDEKSF